MKQRIWKIAGINFDHFHMGDLLRYTHDHPNAEIVAISDEQPARMEEAVSKGLVTRDRTFTDYRECMEKTRPDVVILCPAASKHGEWVKKVAPFGCHIMVEKPFAASLKEADAMAAAVRKGQVLCIIEAMKLMNEIESETDGRIVKILAESTKSVEYGQALFLIDPNAHP